MISPQQLAEILIIVGAAASVGPMRQMHVGYASRNWPRTPARITSATEEFYLSVSGRGHTRTGAAPIVRYSYSIDGEPFTGDRVRWGGVTGWGGRALVAKYPVGAEVEVAVDPADPYRSVLEPGLGANAVVNLLYGAAIALAGAMWLFNL